MESQPQNPEFRISHENFHLCTCGMLCENPTKAMEVTVNVLKS